MNVRTVFRTFVVVAVTLLLQMTVLLEIRIDGATPDVMFLLPIAAGIAAGPVEGAAVGFVAGIAADLLVPTPFGLSALVGTLIGFGVGAVTASGGIVRDVRGYTTVVALVVSAIAVMLYAVLGAVLGESQFLHVGLGVVVAVVAIGNAILAGPGLWVLRWAFAPSTDHAPVSGRR